MNSIAETKTRTPKTKSNLEVELHAAKRVGDMLKALSTEARGRVLELVISHNNETYTRELAEKQTRLQGLDAPL